MLKIENFNTMKNVNNKTVKMDNSAKVLKVKTINGITAIDTEDIEVNVTRIPQNVFEKYLKLNIKYKIDTVAELNHRQFLGGAIWSQLGLAGKVWFHKINEMQPNYNFKETDSFFMQTSSMISDSITSKYMYLIDEEMRLLAGNVQSKASKNV